jgi:F-type H+-transporting ATPase subunit b
MDPTLKALTQLLLRAVPTIFFLVLLTVYLKYIFFKPLERVLEERHKATEGVRKLAEEAFRSADAKAVAFEEAVQRARIEMHREQEAQRHKWLAEQAKTIAAARAQAEARIDEAKRDLAVETERATTELTLEARGLAKQIVASLLNRRAA